MKSFELNDVLSALSHIRGGIPATRLSSRIRLGEHKSTFFGPSYDFYDIKEYDPESDSPSQIIPSLISSDEDIIYARKCIEQHEVQVIFLTDLSSSLDAGVNFAKRRLLLEAVGFVGISAARYQDPIGLVGFTDEIVLNQPARAGVNNFYHLLGMVYEFLDDKDPFARGYVNRGTDFSVALDFIRRSFARPCLVPVISDFVGFEKLMASPLLNSVIAKHELLFIFLDDPEELRIGKGIGYIRLENFEDGQRVIVSRRKLAEIEKKTREQRKEMRRELRAMGIDSIVLEYGRHFNRLYRFFMARHKYRRV